MAAKAMSILFTDRYGAASMDLAAGRTLATVPFGGRYRLIDFILSSLVHAGISNIGVLTRERYGSLVDHLGWGKDWDLDRRDGGLKILTPFAKSENEYSKNHSKVDALVSIESYFERCQEENVVLADSNLVMNIDLNGMIDFHEKKNADITLLYDAINQYKTGLSITCNSQGRVVDAYRGENNTSVMSGFSFPVAVFKKDFLVEQIKRAHTFGWSNLERDFITRNINRNVVCAYPHEGYAAVINHTVDYYEASMHLLKDSIRQELFYGETPILTRIKNSVPTVYGQTGKARDSLVADGCHIEGEVDHCIIFRNVKIQKNVQLKNCIIMQNSVVEEGAKLHCIIADKNVVISKNHTLIGYPTYPFIIAKGQMV